MKTVTSKIKKAEAERIESVYKDYKVKDFKNSSVAAFYKLKGLAITVYKTGTLLLQGESSAIANFTKGVGPIASKPRKINFSELDGTIGMDEVGTGDYFGPVVTCACYVPADSMAALKDLKVNDSKKILDSSIRTMAKAIKKYVICETCICMPKTYNKIIEQFDNSNIVKAICHNDSLTKLTNKVKDKKYKVILDQFVNRANYYSYLIDKAKVKAAKIDIIEMKAESKYLAVACASVIARDAFLTKMEEMSKAVGITLPRGAVEKDKIVRVGKLLTKKAKLADYAKLHFEDITNKISN